MNAKRVRWSVQLALLATFIATTVSAQTDGDRDQNDDVTGMNFIKAGQASFQEQKSQVGNYVQKIKMSSKRVAKLADKAKSEKDIIKLNCVNVKASSINGHLTLANGVKAYFDSSEAVKELEKRNHQFAMITISYQKVVVLEQDASQCIGEDLAYVGKTRTETKVDDKITKKDTTTTGDGSSQKGPVERGPVSSAWQ